MLAAVHQVCLLAGYHKKEVAFRFGLYAALDLGTIVVAHRLVSCDQRLEFLRVLGWQFHASGLLTRAQKLVSLLP